MVVSESSFGVYVCLRRPAGLHRNQRSCAAKSADLVVGSKPPPSACLFMNGTAIPRVQRHVHLGITITSDLCGNDHVATVLKKVAPALHLSFTLACRHQLPPAVIRKFYVAFIRPRMEYCNAVWCGASAKSLRSLENAQLKVARVIVHTQRGQLGPEVLSECNLPTLAWRRRVHCLCLLYILYKGQGSPSLSELLPATVQAQNRNSPSIFSLVSVSICLF